MTLTLNSNGTITAVDDNGISITIKPDTIDIAAPGTDSQILYLGFYLFSGSLTAGSTAAPATASSATGTATTAPATVALTTATVTPASTTTPTTTG
jgi:hypothetical protein